MQVRDSQRCGDTATTFRIYRIRSGLHAVGNMEMIEAKRNPDARLGQSHELPWPKNTQKVSTNMAFGWLMHDSATFQKFTSYRAEGKPEYYSKSGSVWEAEFDS